MVGFVMLLREWWIIRLNYEGLCDVLAMLEGR